MKSKKGALYDEMPVKLIIAVLIIAVMFSVILIFKDSPAVTFFKNLPSKMGITPPNDFGGNNAVISSSDVRIKYSIVDDKMYTRDKVKWVEIKNVDVGGQTYNSTTLLPLFRGYWFVGRDNGVGFALGDRRYFANVMRFNHAPILVGGSEQSGTLSLSINKDEKEFEYLIPADEGNVYLYVNNAYRAQITDEYTRPAYQNMIDAIKEWKIAQLKQPIAIPSISETFYFCADNGQYTQSKDIVINLDKKVGANGVC